MTWVFDEFNLSLEGNPLSEKSFEILSKYIKLNTKLVRLKLYETGMTAKSAQEILCSFVYALDQESALIKLELPF